MGVEQVRPMDIETDGYLTCLPGGQIDLAAEKREHTTGHEGRKGDEVEPQSMSFVQTHRNVTHRNVTLAAHARRVV